MPGRQDDDLARRAGCEAAPPAPPAPIPPSRSRVLGIAVALAVVATLVAFLAADVVLLRGAAVVAAWAVVAAAYTAVRQAGESRLAEQELRRMRDLVAAARRNREQGRENGGRRASDELLREQTAELTRLREQMARISGLGDSLAGLARLREDVAALGALRGELAALRAELTGKVDAEMLVERISLRTRGRATDLDTPAEAAPGATAPPGSELPSWPDEPPRELTGGWPAVRLDPPLPTREYESVGREGEWQPATTERSAVPLDLGSAAWPGADRAHDPLSDPLPETPRHRDPASGRAAYGDHRYAPSTWRNDLPADPSEPLDQPWTPPPSVEEPTTGPLAAQGPQPVPFRRRRDDEAGGPPTDPAQAATAEKPASSARVRPPLPPYGAPAPQPDTAGHSRLSEILAENGAPPTGGRRRRRYREDGETDDVLARVLRGE